MTELTLDQLTGKLNIGMGDAMSFNEGEGGLIAFWLFSSHRLHTSHQAGRTRTVPFLHTSRG
jgi:hypothetical protein